MKRGEGIIALIGDPVAQSVSPAIHNAAFVAAGLDLTYVPVQVSTEQLPRRFPALRESFVGLNVTSPLKEAVVPLLDVVHSEAREAGSINTVVFDGDRSQGFSTDGAGFLAALARAGVRRPRRATILGTGGAARAVTAALMRTGTSVTVLGRSLVAGQRLAQSLTASVRPHPGQARGCVEYDLLASPALGLALDRSDLLVNATPVGSRPVPGESPLPVEVALPHDLAVFDLVYRPRRTALLNRAAASGCAVVEGIEMLVEQGARSFKLWTGVEAPTQVMREAGYRALTSPPARDEQGTRITSAKGVP